MVGVHGVLEALHGDEGQCHWAVAIEAGWRWILWNRDDGGDALEASGDNSLAQRGVEEVCEDICELIRYLRLRCAMLSTKI